MPAPQHRWPRLPEITKWPRPKYAVSFAFQPLWLENDTRYPGKDASEGPGEVGGHPRNRWPRSPETGGRAGICSQGTLMTPGARSSFRTYGCATSLFFRTVTIEHSRKAWNGYHRKLTLRHAECVDLRSNLRRIRPIELPHTSQSPVALRRSRSSPLASNSSRIACFSASFSACSRASRSSLFSLQDLQIILLLKQLMHIGARQSLQRRMAADSG